LKRVSTDTSITGLDVAQYKHTVKLLVERCASVLFDEAFGQELLTRLVVSMETVSSQSSIAEVVNEEIIRDLRILLALSVYHKDILPADDMFQYVNSVLCNHRGNSIPDVSPKSTSAQDPCTPVELCLQILCCLLGGGPIYGPKDAGGSGATLDQQTADFQATLEDTTEGGDGDKRSKRHRTARSALAYPFYSGSGEQLYEQANQILPLLVHFCTTGLTADYPPVPVIVESKKGSASNANSGKSKNHHKFEDWV
uniref:MMS19 nucleotide excision repair protein n=1 Tax=Rodentolepis nana TaxID=102285 RepID=A0A0R3TGC7_RODNA